MCDQVKSDPLSFRREHTLFSFFTYFVSAPIDEESMDNPNPKKVAKVEEIATKLEAAGTVVVTEYRGLDVPAQAALRQALRDAGGEYKIYKNTLTRIAADKRGLDFGEHLSGPTGLAFACGTEDTPADPVGLAKALTDFAKENEALVIKGGVMDGDPITTEEVTALSKVPPREEMLAKFAGLLQAPLSGFAGLLQAMPRDFAGLVKALIDKGGAGVAEEAPAEEAPAEEAAAEEAAGEEAASDTESAPEAKEGSDEAAKTEEADASEEPEVTENKED